MLSKEEASGRPDIFWNNIRMLDKKLGKETQWSLTVVTKDFQRYKAIIYSFLIHFFSGILFNDANAYRNQRRYIHRTLRDFGFGKASLEIILQGEAEHIVDHFDGLKGKAVQPQLVFNVGVLNVLWKIVADKR